MNDMGREHCKLTYWYSSYGTAQNHDDHYGTDYKEWGDDNQSAEKA